MEIGSSIESEYINMEYDYAIDKVLEIRYNPNKLSEFQLTISSILDNIFDDFKKKINFNLSNINNRDIFNKKIEKLKTEIEYSKERL